MIYGLQHEIGCQNLVKRRVWCGFENMILVDEMDLFVILVQVWNLIGQLMKELLALNVYIQSNNSKCCIWDLLWL